MTAATAATIAAGGYAGPAGATTKTVPLIKPKVVATFTDPGVEETAALDRTGALLLRADGAFGYLTEPLAVPRENAPMQLVSFGGPIPVGTMRRQDIADALGGTPPFPRATASGVDGYDWVFDIPRVQGNVFKEPGLLAIDDRGRVAKRVPLDLGPRSSTPELVPTGEGLRLILRGSEAGLELRRSDGELLATVPQLSQLRYAIGRPDGSVLLSGWAQDGVAGDWSRSLILASKRGKISRVRSRGKLVSGDPVTAVRGGVLLGTPTAYEATGLAKLSAGRVLRRTLKQLRLPWSTTCLTRRDGLGLDWATAGSAGDPVLGVSCFAWGDRTNEVLESFTVGLDGQLRVQWVAPGGRAPQVGPDGRLYSAASFYRSVGTAAQSSDYTLFALREPGAGKPRRGRVLSVRADGRGAVVKIRCDAPDGTVCAGTARLNRDGGNRAVTVRYALRGRPGNSAAVINRHVDRAPSGTGRLRVTLGR